MTYDIILFGVTGFTGKLTAEYLLQKPNLHWAACARSETKAQAALQEIINRLGGGGGGVLPPVLVADLICSTDADKDQLSSVVQQAKVVLTCCGPFEKYGTTLVELCVAHNVHYADITGETDFVRHMVQQFDQPARANRTAIVCHCGNDCIPQDLTVHEMYVHAKQQSAVLKKVETIVEVPETASLSGGTTNTAAFQLAKSRSSTRPGVDPLLLDASGQASSYRIKNICPKTTVKTDLGNVGPWIMGPVMMNCVRRSNALLEYASDMEYGDGWLESPLSLGAWWERTFFSLRLAASVYLPWMTRFLPQPGEGPDRNVMEQGYCIVHGRGVMQKGDNDIYVESEFRFGKDVAYLYTAAMLVECGLMLLGYQGTGGVLTPAAAFGSELVTRICGAMEATFELKQVEGSSGPPEVAEP